MSTTLPDGRTVERWGWRDAEISKRHHEWGDICHAVDIDFLLVEHAFGKAAAMIEYKHHKVGGCPNLDGVNYRALREIANNSNLPFIVALYWPETWAFRVWPGNANARRWVDDAQPMSEQEFVLLHHRLRNRVAQEHVIREFNNVRPESPQ